MVSIRYSFSSAGKGLLAQDDPLTDDSKFNHLTSNFGLLASSWDEFHDEFLKLKQSAPENVRYKVLYLARHGQGFHNLAIEIYGQKEWDVSEPDIKYWRVCRETVGCCISQLFLLTSFKNYWSLLNGDGKIVWGPDAELTPLGVQQAKDNHIAWKEQITKKVRLPDSYYTSPFTRSLDTMLHTWKGISLDTDNALRPLVMEDLREDLGVHTCDKRRTKSFIEDRFGSIVDVEPSFTEEDELWTDHHRETHAEHNARSRNFLNHIFDTDWDIEDSADYISVTSHSGTTNSLLKVIGHRKFQLGTGGMIPVIVRAER